MRKKILMVDDDLETVKLIDLMLKRRGYEVISAYTGDQALEKAETENPDLIILDVMMPDLDGFEVCQRLRSNPNTASVPVIMFTAKALVGDKVAGFQAGADDYLTKPIHPSDLVSRVEALIQRAAQTRADLETLPRARTIGVLGAKGGVGASTVVVNLAAATALHAAPGMQQGVRGSVSVADVRAGLGAVALLLGQAAQNSWDSLMAQGADALDAQTVDRLILTHSTGLRILPASVQPDDQRPALSSSHVDAVVRHMAASAGHLFLDLGSIMDEAACHAATLCDVILVVVEPDTLCLSCAQVLLEKLQSLDPAPHDVRLVQVARAETDAGHSRQEVEELLGQNLFGAITAAPLLARQAVEQGQPIVALHPESEIADQFRELSQKLLA